MKKRTDYLVKAWSCIIVLLSYPILILLDEIDPEVYVIAGIVGILLIFLAIYYLWAASRTPREKPLHEPPPGTHDPVRLQLSYFKRALLLSTFMIPISGALTLWFLEPDMEQVRRSVYWIPLQFINDRSGYWPTVLTLPTFFSIASLLFIWKIRKIRSIVEITYS